MNFTQLMNKGLFGEPAFLLGFIAFLGLIIQRTPFSKTVSGTIKAMLGFSLLQIGAAAAGSSLSNLTLIIQNGFHIIGIIPHNETVSALAQVNFGQEIAFIMLIGMIFHLLIARFTRYKYIFLTGHHILFMASLLAGTLTTSGLPEWLKYMAGGVALALSMSFGPVITQPFTRQITGGNQFAIGHFNSTGYVLSGLVARWVRSPKEKQLQLPASTLNPIKKFLQDQMVTITVFTFLLFMVAVWFSPEEGTTSMKEMFSGRPLFIICVIQAVWFAAGVYIILAGVRMMLSEIIPAFQGIAQKIVPGAIPALDCPVLFGYAPLAAVMGFLLSFIGGIAAMCIMLLVLSQYTVIIPGVIPHFFSGGAAGVIAYKTGGRRGLIAASLVHGFFITFLPLFLLPLQGFGFARATFADSDFFVVGIMLRKLLDFFF
jgi:ascorbate PTS system EIIC component